MRIIDYDQIDVWGAWFREIVSEIADDALLTSIREAQPEYIEDARDHFVSALGRDRIVEHLNDRLSHFAVRVFHGTRLTEEEVSQIRRDGLKSLTLIDRRERLIETFNQHPEWEERKGLLDGLLQRLGVGWETNWTGRREDGCVHVCLSRAGLLYGCNHYLKYGAEVDGHVAHGLFPDKSGKPYLSRYGRAKIISFTAPFSEAARAANPHGFPAPPDMPSLLETLFSAWAYRLAKPQFTVVSQRDDVALRFPAPITADRLSFEDIEDRDMSERKTKRTSDA